MSFYLWQTELANDQSLLFCALPNPGAFKMFHKGHTGNIKILAVHVKPGIAMVVTKSSPMIDCL